MRGATDLFFSHLGVEDGLSQLSVLHIFQDSDGYIWFATRNGANRYDGYEFVIYQNEVNNSASLSDNYIRRFTEDKQKNIWVATSNGINCIDYKSKEVTRFYPQLIDRESTNNVIYTFLKQADGTIYAFNSRWIFRCNPNQTVERIWTDVPIESPVYSAAQDEKGDIYLGTEKAGLYVFSKDWKLKMHILPGEEENTLPKSMISTILPNGNGLIWIGTEEEGICLYDRKKQTFTRLNKKNSGLSSNGIRAMIPYRKNTILVGTFGGLNSIDTQTHTVTLVDGGMSGDGGLSHFSIHSLLMDKDHGLWVGTYYGVNYHSPYYRPAKLITPQKYTKVIGKGGEDANGNMWFATEGAGLFFYDPQTGQQELYPIKSQGKGNYEMNIIKSVLIKGDSILCSTHFGTVYLFSIRTKRYRLLYDFEYNDICSLYMDREGCLWIPTNSSMGLVMEHGGKIQNTFEMNGATRSFRGITTILELKPDLFLFGTLSDSLYLYDRGKKTVLEFSSRLYKRNKSERLGVITGLLKDQDQQVWIFTSKNGIFRMDDNLRMIKHYHKEDGITESLISSVTLDKKGDLWVTAGCLLYKLDKKQDRFISIKTVEIPRLEFTLYSGNNVGSDGTIYFPGDKGILAFNPGQKVLNPALPAVYVTSLMINNKEEMLGLSDKQRLTLKSSQNNLIIKYTGINFIHSEINQYTYKLEGADLNWHPVGSRREAYYNNLAPGSYIFHLKAANNDGVWNPKETVLYIIINPPFYKTWWAYLLYISIFFFIVAGVIRQQWKKNEREHEIRFKQMEQEKLNELHEERMRMFTNFSHELRTPLTLIINPLNDLMQHLSFSPEVKKTLQLMRKNTGRMLLLVNNLMDIQKYGAGKTDLQKTRFDFSSFIREIYHSFESIANNREIIFRLKNELPAIYYVRYDEREIEKAFFNLLSNAFKYTPSGGNVTLRVKSIPQSSIEMLPRFPLRQKQTLVEINYLLVEVLDTGKGFNSKDTEKIFEPFYHSQEDIHQEISGSGIGLSLTHSIILQHNGYIWMESEEGKGSRFMFLLPDTETQEVEVETAPLSPHQTEISQKVNLLIKESEMQDKPLIMLVDDNREVLQYLEEQLGMDYMIVKASDGKEALQKIKESSPHIVVSDVMMPEMNGIELCRRIKEDPTTCQIPVVLLTAKYMALQIEEGLDAGADDYIVKPFQLSILKARIRNLLSLRQKLKVVYEEGHLSSEQLGLPDSADGDEFLKNYIDIIKANLSNPELDIVAIYESLGMSRTSFYRKVKAITGLSPIDLIKSIRLEAGARLLRESRMNISEIAQQVGFSSRSYFARNFKEAYGLSPTEYQDAYHPPHS